jgi:Leucine-rich repeat (LRR) protein
MKISFLIISMFLFAVSCRRTDSDKKNEKTKTYKVDHKIILNSGLTKLSTDTFKIDRKAMLIKSPSRYFKEREGYCKLENDTVKLFLREGRFTTTHLKIFIANQTFDTDTWIYDCTSSGEYKPISQSIEVNKKTFKVGDTIIGHLNYTGLPYSGSKFVGTDTLTTKGKFKFLIRPSTFTFEDLEKENNYNDFIALSKSNPDTIKEVSLWYSGLHQIPKEILFFKNLESLSLEDNDLSQTDFSILRQLPKLKKLILQECRLTKIPSSIFSLTALEEFDIYSNYISEIPEELFNLSNLKSLQIGSNNLKNLSPNISKLSRLEWIEFSDTQIMKLPNEMTKLKYLKEVYPNDTMFYIPNKIKPLLASSCTYVTSR